MKDPRRICGLPAIAYADRYISARMSGLSHADARDAAEALADHVRKEGA